MQNKPRVASVSIGSVKNVAVHTDSACARHAAQEHLWSCTARLPLDSPSMRQLGQQLAGDYSGHAAQPAETIANGDRLRGFSAPARRGQQLTQQQKEKRQHLQKIKKGLGIAANSQRKRAGHARAGATTRTPHASTPAKQHQQRATAMGSNRSNPVTFSTRPAAAAQRGHQGPALNPAPSAAAADPAARAAAAAPAMQGVHREWAPRSPAPTAAAAPATAAAVAAANGSGHGDGYISIDDEDDGDDGNNNNCDSDGELLRTLEGSYDDEPEWQQQQQQQGFGSMSDDEDWGSSPVAPRATAAAGGRGMHLVGGFRQAEAEGLVPVDDSANNTLAAAAAGPPRSMPTAAAATAAVDVLARQPAAAAAPARGCNTATAAAARQPAAVRSRKTSAPLPTAAAAAAPPPVAAAARQLDAVRGRVTSVPIPAAAAVTARQPAAATAGVRCRNAPAAAAAAEAPAEAPAVAVAKETLAAAMAAAGTAVAARGREATELEYRAKAAACRAVGVRRTEAAAAARRYAKVQTKEAAWDYERARRHEETAEELMGRRRKVAKVGDGDVRAAGAWDRRRRCMAAAAAGGGGGRVGGEGGSLGGPTIGRGGGGKATAGAAVVGTNQAAAAAGGGGGGGQHGLRRGPSWADGLVEEDYQRPMSGVNWKRGDTSWVASWVNAGTQALEVRSFAAKAYGFFNARDMAVGARRDALASGRART